MSTLYPSVLRQAADEKSSHDAVEDVCYALNWDQDITAVACRAVDPELWANNDSLDARMKFLTAALFVAADEELARARQDILAPNGPGYLEVPASRYGPAPIDIHPPGMTMREFMFAPAADHLVFVTVCAFLAVLAIAALAFAP